MTKQIAGPVHSARPARRAWPMIAAAGLLSVGLVTSAQAKAAGAHGEHAFHPEYYIGLSVGGADVEASQFDDTDVGFRVFGGYQMTPHWGFELGYVNFGEMSDGVDVEIDGFEFSGTGTWEIAPKWDVFGRLGVLYWDDDTLPAGSPLDNDNGEAFAAAVGARWQFSKQLSARAEFAGYDIEDTDNVYLLSVGIEMVF